MKCPNCKKLYTPDLVQQDAEKVALWQAAKKEGRAALIQNAWPKATSTQREQLQTGICSDACWDEYLRVAERGMQ